LPQEGRIVKNIVVVERESVRRPIAFEERNPPSCSTGTLITGHTASFAIKCSCSTWVRTSRSPRSPSRNCSPIRRPEVQAVQSSWTTIAMPELTHPVQLHLNGLPKTSCGNRRGLLKEQLVEPRYAKLRDWLIASRKEVPELFPTNTRKIT